jgi:hypothetical protein
MDSKLELPAQVPPSETLWLLLTNGYSYSIVIALDDGDATKQMLISRAQHRWNQIRTELRSAA